LAPVDAGRSHRAFGCCPVSLSANVAGLLPPRFETGFRRNHGLRPEGFRGHARLGHWSQSRPETSLLRALQQAIGSAEHESSASSVSGSVTSRRLQGKGP
jgi:hypothetical protein